MTIQTEVSYLSSEEGVQLWQQDSRYTEYQTIKQLASESRQNGNFEVPEYEKYINWNPTVVNPKRNMLLIQKHISGSR